jgi:GntR family transcriptional regulator
MDVLRREIAAAPPNTMLPTEQEYARRFEVSRATVRRALGLLERSGLLSRRRGRGTIVSPPKVVRSLAPLYTMEEDFRQQGIKLETRVLQYEPAFVPPPGIRDRLRLPPDGRVGFLTLLRLVEGRAIAYDRSFLPESVARRFHPEELGDRPLLEVLRDLTGIRVAALDWEIEIVPSSTEEAAALGLTPGVLVMSSATTASASDGVPIARGERAYRIDRVRFRYAAQYAADAAPVQERRGARRDLAPADGAEPDRTASVPRR